MPRSTRTTTDPRLLQAKEAARQGRTELAERLLRAVLEQQPDNAAARKGLRRLRGDRGQRRGAAAPPRRRVDEVIDLLQAGDLERAERACRRLLGAHPRSVILLNLLGVVLQRQDRWDEAVQVFDRTLQLKPDFPEALLNRGIAQREQGRLAEAVASYDAAIQLRPAYAEAHYNRANALKDAGSLDPAAAGYRRAIELSPGFAQAHRNLAALKRFEAADEQLALMERLYDGPAAETTSRIELCFALAKAHEDLGDYDRSFALLSEGNTLRRKELRYDPEEDRRLFAAIREAFARVGDAAAAREDESADEPAAPVFVVGMMRSGTSLVEQILASHGQVHGAGELETMSRLVLPLLPESVAAVRRGEAPLSPSRRDALRNGYLRALRALHVPEPVITDKMPLNFRWIGFIMAAFPGARIVHVKRDPLATCWSIYKHFFPDEGHGYAWDLEELATYYELYEDLMDFWYERFADNIHELRYEALIEEQEARTRALLSFCGLEWDERCLHFHRTERVVRTLSAAQVRRALYRGASDEWRRHASHLDELRRRLSAPAAE